MIGAPLVALALERPLALLLLVVPIVLLVLARRRAAAEVLAVGELAPWRRAMGAGADPRVQRPEPPAPALVLALVALTLGVAALAGPRADTAARAWTAVIDTSASLDLPDGGGTRRDRAVAAAQALAKQHGATLLWTTAEIAELEDRGWPTPESALAEAARRGLSGAHERPFRVSDRSGILGVTDAEPPVSLVRAGLVAGGGADAPGPVAVEGHDLLEWNDGQLVRRVGAAPTAAVRVAGLDAARGTRPLERALRAWIEARGRAVVFDASQDEVVLTVRATPLAPEAPRVRAGRDGWNAEGPAGGALDPDLWPWLGAETGALVVAGPGRVEIGWTPEQPDDPVAFAVSWARLFDASELLVRGVVPLDARRAAQPFARAPQGSDVDVGVPWSAILAFAAAAAALAALAVRRP